MLLSALLTFYFYLLPFLCLLPFYFCLASSPSIFRGLRDILKRAVYELQPKSAGEDNRKKFMQNIGETPLGAETESGAKAIKTGTKAYPFWMTESFARMV